MRVLFLVRGVILVAALAGAGAALGHHGWTGYDEERTLKLTGTVREPRYEQPHGVIRLETSGKTWTVVLAPPTRMQARGLAEEALAAGAQATVVGYPHLEKPDELRAERITIAGKTVELR
jgi:hypothetical protein